MSHLAKNIWVRQKTASSVLRSDGTTGTAKSDTLKLAAPAHGFHANAAGTVTAKDPDGNSNAFVVVAGGTYPYEVAQIMSTGTTLADTEIILGWGP